MTAPQQHIAPVRRAVAKLLEVEGSVPVYAYLPDDPAHVPCYVVGRPSINESDLAAVMTVTLDVMVLGRRLADEDAQAELDTLGDEAFDIVGGTRGVKVLDAQLLRCTNVRPLAVFVAGTEMPAYALTVAIDIITC